MCAERQERDDPPAGVAAGAVSDVPRTSIIMFSCVSCDALGRPGRPRGVDQRQDVLRLHRAPGRLEVETGGPASSSSSSVIVPSPRRRRPRRARPRPRRADRSRDPRQEGPLGDHDAVAGVREQVLDLRRRRRVVDRERRRAQVQRGGVDQKNSGRLTSISATVSPRPTPSAANPAGDPTHSLRVLPISDRHSITRCAKRDLVRALRRRQLKRLAERRRVQRRRAREGLRSRALHRVPPQPWPGRPSSQRSDESDRLNRAPQRQAQTPPRPMWRTESPMTGSGVRCPPTGPG